jgi:hypothetical protein
MDVTMFIQWPGLLECANICGVHKVYTVCGVCVCVCVCVYVETSFCERVTFLTCVHLEIFPSLLQ